jgi:putative NADPH-quinone reductase
MIDLFAPLRAMAHRCGLDWAEPFVLYRAMKLSDNELGVAGSNYATTLSQWIATSDRMAA